MQKLIIVVIALFCAAPLCAQTAGAAGTASDAAAAKTAAKTATKAAAKAAAKTPAAQPAAQPAQAAQAAPAKQAAKAGDQDEESMVMIDNKAEIDENRYTASEGETEERAAVPGGLPSSYGQCKGVVTEGGRTVLVFESADDGAISLVQLTLGRAGASWKLLDRIPRSAD